MTDLEDSQIPVVPQKQTEIKKPLLTVVLVVALCVVVGSLIWYGAKLSGIKQEVKISIPEDMAGTIILSLMPLDNTANPGIYAFDIAKNELKEIYASKEADSVISNAVLQPSGKLIAFVEKKQNGVSDVNTLNLESKEVKNVFFMTGAAIDWIDWSPDGNNLVYSSYFLGKEEAPAAGKPVLGQWRISISDLSGSQKFVAHGSCPRFISDEEVSFIKEGGLWQINILNGAEKLIFENQSIKQDTQIAFAEDFSTIAWTAPPEKKFYLGKLNESDGAFSLGDLKTIDIWAFSPRISPDLKYIITYWPKRVIARDINTLKVSYILDLTKFFASDKIISDWVISLP